jgi:hypothetical protein
MYGWVHRCLKETIIKLCGEEKWQEILQKSGIVNKLDVSSKDSYNEDAEYFALLNTTLEVLPHITEEALYNLYGDYFIKYVEDNGYESYLKTFGDTLFDLLNNMNRLHTHLACSMEKMKIPIINCTDCDEEGSFTLHYSSPRGSRLTGMLVGLVKSVGRSYFSVRVTLQELVRQGDANGSPSTIWKVCYTFYCNINICVCKCDLILYCLQVKQSKLGLKKMNSGIADFFTPPTKRSASYTLL